MEHITKQQIYDLLYRALIDLRAEGHATQNQLVFLLADLFHNIPLQLNRVDHGDLAPDDVLAWLRRRAQGTLMEDWLNLRVPDVVAENADRQVAQDITPDENEPH
jgi:hypothetical protein